MPSTILVTSLADSGRGTLRAAIEQARNGPSHLGGRMHSNTIKFARSVRGTIALTTALPILANDIVISGPGSQTSFPTGPGQPLTVTRSDAMETAAFSIFTVAKGAVVSMRGLTITGGSAPDGGGIDNAGSLSLVDTTIVGNSATSVGSGSPAATLGGGIDNTGTLSVASSAFYDNSAAGGTNGTGVTGYGGAIANSGRLSVANSTFVDNSATDGGGIMNSGTASITGSQVGYESASGGSDSSGGAIDNTGTLSVANCDFTSDTATVLVAGGSSFGGAIASSGTLSVSLSEFLGNVASSVSKSYGGAIHNSGTMSVTSSSFDVNSATGQTATGGGATPDDGYGGGIDNSGTLSVTDSTLAGNSATSPELMTGGLPTADYGYGGGINNSGMLSVTNSTLFGNKATGFDGSSGGGIADSGTASLSYVTANGNSAATGGGVAITSGTQSVVDSIDSIYRNTQGGNASVAAGSFSSLGHNIFSDDPVVSLDPTDLVNTDPSLGTLIGNGGPGPTRTETLLPGSPAIDSGISITGITTDERGAPRPSSGATDIGAFQVQPPLSVVSLRRSGTDHLVLTFNLPLDASPAQSLANYRLVKAGGNERVISIRSAQYSAASHSVTLRLKTRLSLNQAYVLTVIGTSPGGLTTNVGFYLGAANLFDPGTNYVVTIT